MLKRAYTLILSPRGRIGRVSFVLGGLVMCGLWLFQHYIIYPALGNGVSSFFLPMFFFFLGLHIFYCVYGKRLHDLGRSNWVLIGMLSILIVVVLVVILKFGGLEYFETIMNNPQRQNDPEWMRDVHTVYRNTLTENLAKSQILMTILPIIFTMWLAIVPGQTDVNRYGAAPNTGV